MLEQVESAVGGSGSSGLRELHERLIKMQVDTFIVSPAGP